MSVLRATSHLVLYKNIKTHCGINIIQLTMINVCVHTIKK